MVGTLVMSSGIVLMTAATSAQATQPDPHKVFVCKYVGTPGEDEVLQTGNNPISVDTNALQGKGFTAQHPSTSQFPFWFSDAQGRSVAFKWDDVQGGGQSGEPSLSECPAPPRPPEDNKIDAPDKPGTNDPCGPNNIAFVVPGDTEELDWTLLPSGDVQVQPQAGHEFKGNSQLVSFTRPADSDEDCPQVDQEIAVPAQPAVLDPCDAANNSFEARADTDQLDWELLADKNLTVRPKTGFKFPGESQLVTFNLPADGNAPCPTTVAPPATPPVVAGVEEVVPGVSFTDPTCDASDAAAWTGTFTDVVAYTVLGEAAAGEDVVVTAALKPGVTGHAIQAGADTKFEHSFPSIDSLQCGEVLGVKQLKGPKATQKPVRAPVVLGTQAAVPTSVSAGLGSLPTAGAAPGDLLGRMLTAGGLALLLAAGWLAMGRRGSRAGEA